MIERKNWDIRNNFFFSGMRTVLSQQNAERKRFLIYCLYAWGVPVIHTLIVFLINTYGDEDSGYHPEIGKRRCFLGGINKNNLKLNMK